MVQEDALGRFRMSIEGVADVNPDVPGLRYARQIGIDLVTTDYRDLYEIPNLGLVIELTGSDAVRDEIERTRPKHVRLIDHFGARLFWQLHQAEEAIIRQRTEMRERVTAGLRGRSDTYRPTRSSSTKMPHARHPGSAGARPPTAV